ncbi:GNAT family N-acetyltransferase [Acinetobacter sp. ULE_I001]|jgi:RimJ/RimL family protein N-acetyltransferase|uniref:GNAT family N-acetyltransferase n=1 Tax=unclassified Acinetobacter TaxID=196816 RepID=UPI003017FB19
MKTFTPPVQLETPRLILRQWQVRDFDVFADLNADPDVMRYFPAALSKNESDLLAGRFQDTITEYGWGFWAVELKENQQFIGFVGLANQAEKFTFSPCVEIGWRLAQQYWHQGYATEAAQQCLKFAFEKLALEQVVSFTTVLNQASEKVMQRLGMDYVENFMHPVLDKNHALAEHVLYRIQNPKL